MLTGLSGFWFARTREIVPNHMLALRDDGRSIECRRLEMLPIECVVRGYLAGSGWKDYQATGAGLRARAAGGARESDAAAAADLHAGDEGGRPATTRTSTATAAAELVGQERFAAAERISLELYRYGAAHAAERGIILADTKFELGARPGRRARARRRGADARLLALLAGRRVRARARPAVVRQAVRPRLLRDARVGQDRARARSCRTRSSTGTRARYVEAFERLTGIAFDDYLANPEVVLA